MTTRIDEIADGVYRLSTYVREVGPTGLTFNQFLVRAEEPLLFHTGPRRMLPLVREAAGRVLPPESLRWITFGHYESDECGAMNAWLEAAPRAQVAHGLTACMVDLEDAADRPPRALRDGETLELGGGKRVRYLDTPHVPHGWEAGLIYEESTGTLLCGDLFTQGGAAPPTTDGDIVGPAIAAEDVFGSSSLHPSTGAVLRRLAGLAPRRLALMHGPTFEGDAAAALRALAEDYDRRRGAAPV